MFDTMMIAKKIKQARIGKNMTQMNLADALGVSFLAVSNWERGNSMPDISKLGDLCAALDISVNDLLGIDAPVVTKAMEQEELTMEELSEVAPLLPPETVREHVEKMQQLQEGLQDLSACLEQTFGDGSKFEMHIDRIVDAVEKGDATVHVVNKGKKQKKKLDLSRIAEMAPYLDQEYLDRLVEDADLSDLDGLEELAPFLSKQTLDKIVDRAQPEDLEEVAEIAPFLSKETLNKLANRCMENDEPEALEELAPFLSEENLNQIALCCADREEFETLAGLAPFLGKEILDRMVDMMIDRGFDPKDADEIEELYPFMGKGSLRKLANYMVQQQDLDALEDLTAYL